MNDVRLLTLDPGHFHAALVQKEMVAGVDRRVHVYAPLGPDLLAHLGRVAGFNARADNPTAWEAEVHAGPDFLERLLAERPGNVVVLAGRNRLKIDYVLAAVRAGLNVLADKPWVLTSADLPKLREALDTADASGLVAYDVMTERHEITSVLQRRFVQDADVFGAPVSGTPDEPGVLMESKHFLMKTVAGVPLRRPPWFFDVREQGEGLTDVGTHLVDLVPWALFPDQPLDPEGEVRVVAAVRWPITMTEDDYRRVTGETSFPESLKANIEGGRLHYFCNTAVSYALRGVHVKLNVLWDFEAPAGTGDTHLAVFRGTRSRVEVRQGPEQNYRPELDVVPNQAGDQGAVLAAVRRKLSDVRAEFPGVAAEDAGQQVRVSIPDRYRVGHEAHFGAVTRQFLEYLKNPASFPAWEKPNMLAKYGVTTAGVEWSRRGKAPKA